MKTLKMSSRGRAGVVVDNELNVLEFLGHTGAYLQLPSGQARFNLRVMVRPGLGGAFVEALREARSAKDPVRRRGVLFSVEDETKKVNITVHRLADYPSEAPVFRILFEDVKLSKEESSETAGGAEIVTTVRNHGSRSVEGLQKQLIDTQQNLRAILLDHEETLRKLIQTNDVLDATTTQLEETNTELEAHSDELETANIELTAALAQRDEAERERRKLERQVQHAEKLKSLGVLAGGIAHDFNNLLHVILGFAELGLDDLAAGSSPRKAITEIMTATKQAAGLAEQMLAYSGRGNFQIEATDLSSVVWESAALLRTAVSKKADLQLQLAEALPLIEADRSQLQQVVMNLITNASEALNDQVGRISVATGVFAADRTYLAQTYLDDGLPAGDYVYIEVSDTGCGMDRETLDRVFEPFFSTKFVGRGLGLATVLGIVRGHRGALKVSSQPGRGTTFRVLLPRSGSAAKERERESTSKTIARGQGTILVADDDEPVRSIVKMTLEKAGFQVVTAGDGQETIDRYSGHQAEVRLIILDLTMPRMSADAVLRELRRIDPGVRVILSSGYNEEDLKLRFAGMSLAGFLPKPYSAKRLIDTVFSVLPKDVASLQS